jgi:hypothetical protein
VGMVTKDVAKVPVMVAPESITIAVSVGAEF